MRIGKWIINFRLPWIIEDIQECPTYPDYRTFGQFIKVIPSEAIPAGTAVMMAPDGQVSPTADLDEYIGRAISDSTIDSNGKHTVVIRLEGAS